MTQRDESPVPNIDDLAQEIRRVDGSNSLGAGALAEALMPFVSSRLAASPSSGAVRVKPLEWRDHRPDSFPEPAWSAQTPFGFYNIEEVSASDSPAYVVRLHAHHFIADKDSLEDAQAAAQADYEQRIRSAIDALVPADGVREAFRNIDDSDWQYLQQLLVRSTRHSQDAQTLIWRKVMKDVRAALAQTEGGKSQPAPADDAAVAWRGPTPQMLSDDPLFDAIWQTIKSWDINVPAVYSGYCGATGNHVRAIYDAVNATHPAKAVDVEAIATMLMEFDGCRPFELTDYAQDVYHNRAKKLAALSPRYHRSGTPMTEPLDAAATRACNRIAKIIGMSPEVRDDVHGILQEEMSRPAASGDLRERIARIIFFGINDGLEYDTPSNDAFWTAWTNAPDTVECWKIADAILASLPGRDEEAIRAERDALRARLKEAETDAARYRYLRERDLDAIDKGGVFAGMTPKNIILNLEDLDREVDAARAFIIEGRK